MTKNGTEDNDEIRRSPSDFKSPPDGGVARPLLLSLYTRFSGFVVRFKYDTGTRMTKDVHSDSLTSREAALNRATQIPQDGQAAGHRPSRNNTGGLNNISQISSTVPGLDQSHP